MSDLRDRFTYVMQYDGDECVWRVYDTSRRYDKALPELDQVWGELVLTLRTPQEWEGDGPHPELRKEYERIIGYDPNAQADDVINLVEMIADEDGGFDQPCAYGNRVESHAVYCHNTRWLYAPRKCRRTWYTHGERRDEDCEGYKPNPAYASG